MEDEDSMRLVVGGRTHAMVTSDMPGFPVPRRTFFGRYDYGQIPKVVVDLVIDRLCDIAAQMPRVPRSLRNEIATLRALRHYDRRIL
ncbi:hypothetical protein [Mycobacteroides abscessus]|uniref:hypothetical protein n=1 Tax=Mycobacteroides abscessus TaxID=36809 RepID=UPI00092C2167|nr:hypothetical protein [Mycobacteroides abscessus]SIE12356.1 Uncharacterised protein [Mycobacteroides abscessus subsp. abscessus]